MTNSGRPNRRRSTGMYGTRSSATKRTRLWWTAGAILLVLGGLTSAARAQSTSVTTADVKDVKQQSSNAAGSVLSADVKDASVLDNGVEQATCTSCGGGLL